MDEYELNKSYKHVCFTKAL